MATKRITGSQAIILSLLEEGVDTIFGYPGGAIMPVYDALYDFDRLVTNKALSMQLKDTPKFQERLVSASLLLVLVPLT